MAFKQSAEDQDLDIYQMCAWVSHRDLGTFTKATYYVKAICCWCIQFVGLMLFIYVQLDPFMDHPEEFCRMGSDTSAAKETKTLSVMFAFYIALKTGGSIHDINSSGLYTMNPWNGDDCPPFVSRTWVFFGLYTNVAVTVASLLGSYLVLYHSGDVLDTILNSLALFFVADMDNFMMSQKDYRRVYNWFEEWKVNGKHAHPELSKAAACMAGMCFTPLVYIFTYASIAISFVSPFWIAFCQ